MPAVAQLDQLEPGVPHRVEVGTTPVTLVRIDDEVLAVHDTCSHEEWSLAEGMCFDEQIECALHGSMFDLRTGEPSGPPATTPVPTYAVTVTDGAVHVDVAQPTNDAPEPDHW